MKHTLIESILKEVGTYYNDSSNYLNEEKNPFTNVDTSDRWWVYSKNPGVSDEEFHQGIQDAELKRAERAERDRQDYYDELDDEDLESKLERSREYWQDRRDRKAEPHGFGTSGTLKLFNMDQLEESNAYDLEDTKGDMSYFASKGYGYRH